MYTCLCELGLSYDQIEMVIYGDDIVVSTASKISISDIARLMMEKFQMTFTHWSKKDDYEEDTIETISFIGRKFFPDPLYGKMRAPLPLTTIKEMVYWYKKNANETVESLMVDTARSFFIELSHHSKEVYDEVSKHYLESVREKMPEIYSVVQKLNYPHGVYVQKMYSPGGSRIVAKFAFANDW
jgi:hypothetical protein